jgi:pSer/pThr/pTyr-binding forkhead associated (FHA) protein
MAATVRLTVLTGPHKNSKYCFRGPALSKVGRAEECFVRLSGTPRDLLISRCHCRLDVDPPNIQVRDLNSSNGTFVNGKKVEPVEQSPKQIGDSLDGDSFNGTLSDGDLLTVGGTTLRVDLVDCPPSGTNVPEETIWNENQLAKKSCPFSC